MSREGVRSEGGQHDRQQPEQTWSERHAGWLIALFGLLVVIVTTASSWGVSSGTVAERTAALDRRIEQVETQQVRSDATIEKVRDSLERISSDVSAMRGTVEGMARQSDRMERRIDSMQAPGVRRIQ